MARTRVAINAITELNGKFGVHSYLMGLIRELRKNSSIELVLLIGTGQKSLLPEELQPHAREVLGFFPKSFWQLFYQNRIRKLLLEERVDIYHLPNTLPFLWKPVPTVVTIHDLGELRVHKYGLLRLVYRTLVNLWAATVADRVMTVSENSKTDIVEILGVAPEKVAVVHEGVEERFRRLDRDTCKAHVAKRFGIESDFLLAPGGLAENKNIRNLLVALKELIESGVEVPLILTGHGTANQMKRITRQIRELGLDGSVILTGYVSDQELPFLYGASLVVVYPSLYEGFGLPAIESMACGVPLIASNTSSLLELVGDVGITVNPRDPSAIASALRLLISDESRRQTAIERGLRRAEDFRWEKVVAKTIEVYEGVASGARGRHTNRKEAVAAKSLSA
jgi:glycosyltransferase involved in cell wall biosynthesis